MHALFRHLVQWMPLVAGLSTCGLAFTPVGTHAQALQPERSAIEGGPRRWEITDGPTLALRSAPNDASQTLSMLETGAVLRNLGCERVTDQVWCKAEALDVGPAGYLPADRLEEAEGPDGIVPTGQGDSMARARKGRFDSRFDIDCAQVDGEPLATCQAEVARDTGGDATLLVTFSNGFKRQLSFEHGQFIRANATMSGVGTDIAWQIRNGVYLIRVDDQRFEVPAEKLFAR